MNIQRNEFFFQRFKNMVGYFSTIIISYDINNLIIILKTIAFDSDIKLSTLIKYAIA
jgi:hypothetical protein